MPPTNNVSDALQKFAASLKRSFSPGAVKAHPEDQLKKPIQDFLEACGPHFGLGSVVTRTEAPVEDVGRPDVAVQTSGLLSGFVELKAPGTGARAEKFKDRRNREQWKKFQQLPNLIYTDGNEWTLYRSGERRGKTITLSGEATRDGEAAVSGEDADDLSALLRDFFSWDPIVPETPKGLAGMLAPLCHLVRDDVLRSLEDTESALSLLAGQWRDNLFSDADDGQFADAYAQTLTYSLLLARFSGETDLSTESAADALQSGHGLLAQTLRVLGDPQAYDEISTGVDLLRRSIRAVDPAAVSKDNPDPWLYFYEDFLAAYDRALRGDRGVYYTPVEVVSAQVKLVSELLTDRLGKPLSFADEDVVLLDPAAGTGAYPLAALKHGLELVSEEYGPGMAAGYASQMARSIHAFELLVGPYAVAHLRLSERVMEAGGSLPGDGVHVYLTDTLESPNAAPPGQLMLNSRALAREHRRAMGVKNDAKVLVCLGNPPYDRQQVSPDKGNVERKGGWVRFGDRRDDETPIFSDFLEPAREAGAGGHLKNLYNDYVYFWRWALWKVFEKQDGPGVVSFITASSYLRGPGFVGVREVMRRTFDELWILDLEGDNLGARKTENVFAIRTPVAIAVGVRHGEPNPSEPARVRYAKLEGPRETKLAALGSITGFGSVQWRDCFTGWHNPFLPEDEGDYFSWPLLTDVFPWQHSGVQMKRKWPIGETTELLERRWDALLSASDRQAAFRESRDRKTNRSYPKLDGSGRLDALDMLKSDAPSPERVRYAYRSFDRQWILKDSRLGDFMRPELWQAHGDKQIYMSSLLTKGLGIGPAATASAYVSDLDHFSGRGGKDVIPLWRDSAATQPNVAGGLPDFLSVAYERERERERERESYSRGPLRLRIRGAGDSRVCGVILRGVGGSGAEVADHARRDPLPRGGGARASPDPPPHLRRAFRGQRNPARRGEGPEGHPGHAGGLPGGPRLRPGDADAASRRWRNFAGRPGGVGIRGLGAAARQVVAGLPDAKARREIVITAR